MVGGMNPTADGVLTRLSEPLICQSASPEHPERLPFIQTRGNTGDADFCERKKSHDYRDAALGGTRCNHSDYVESKEYLRDGMSQEISDSGCHPWRAAEAVRG